MTDPETTRVPRVAGTRSGRHRHAAPDDDTDADQPATALAVVDSAVVSRRGRHAAVIDDDADVRELYPPDPPKSRAGRNLPAAIGVAVALAALVLGSLFLYKPSFVIVIMVAISYGAYELVKALSASGVRVPLVPVLVGGIAMETAAWQRGPNGLVVALLITVAALVVWRLADGMAGYQRDVAGSILVLTYLPMLASFAVLLDRADDGVARVITFIAIVVCSDTGGYAAGVLFGKHLLAPIVSKGKTWEGFAGSVLACSICGGLIVSLTFHHAWWQGVLLGLALVVTATLGDLGESLIKRDLGIKDMGSLLPGHGGLMDRLDSLLPCAAVAYLVLTAILGG
ncbi:phosphatidate cytidylyltransferase [Jatrophihabitans sp. GAS493]|uniref:phosphatidate cytidylyltransferase n=1 Tax=Jatrophihabitans sp. GAS493 TaxID=1907575 RepID=UPI000BB71A6B|nr:phosphatidate cytidylyltransferase [Jatrophihabitans sp. GAS493]SOD74188.1 phosphatidate cytidylyltransferase [Jatrophihabitans sp. GAS493]